MDAGTMNALVTGGGGFLGGRIARTLVERGDAVTVLGRREYPDLQAAGIATIQADVRDAGAVASACRGMDVVFHAAACVGIWGPRRTFWQVNVEGTRNVIAACRRAGVPRLVFTDDELCGVDESHPYPPRHLAHYPASKAAAERLVLAANNPALATVALRPHLIWGPGDPHLIPRVVERARQGRLVQVGDGRNLVDVTYIDNAAEAHVLAADPLHPGAACAGRAYFISQGEPVCLWPWLNDLLAKLGAPGTTRTISYNTAYRLGRCCELVWSGLHLRTEPPMTRFLASQLARSHYFDITTARRDLGYKPRVLMSDGLDRVVAWLAHRSAGAGLANSRSWERPA